MMDTLSNFFGGLETWKLVWWGIGTFGVVGVICLCIFAPAAAAFVGRLFFNILSDLLSTRLGCVALTAVLVAGAVDYTRRSLDDKQFEQMTAEFEMKQKLRDAKAADDAKKEVQGELDNLTAQNADLDKRLKEFTDAIPAPQQNAASPDPNRVGNDACQLRVIAGTARPSDCQSPSTQNVPAPGKPGKPAKHNTGRGLPKAGP